MIADPNEVPDPALDRLLCRAKLSNYVRLAWKYADPHPLIWGWHLDAVCDHLQAVSAGQIRNLVINIPPGSSKSLGACVFWPRWEWTEHAEMRWLFSSYSQEFTIRDSLRMRRLIESNWYQERWGHVYTLQGDQNVKSRYETSATGFRLATSVGGVGIGERADRVVVDDPHKPDEAQSDLVRQGVLDWWDQSMSTRDRDPKTCARVIIMQRLHESDLAGHALRDGGYEHLCLPMEWDGKRRFSVLGPYDPRSRPDELLHAERFDAESVAKMKRQLGPYGTAGQLQQVPVPAGGGLVKRYWWRYWHKKDQPGQPVLVDSRLIESRELPDEFDIVVGSWDATFKGNEESDYVVGLTLARKGGEVFLLDRDRDRMDFVATLSAVREQRMRWREMRATLIQDTANGPAIISALRGALMGVLPITVKGSKFARLQAVLPMMAAGNVYLPHPDDCPWTQEFIGWLSSFPAAQYDDDVDALSQGLDWLRSQAQSVLGRDHRDALEHGKPPGTLKEHVARDLVREVKRSMEKRRVGGRGVESGVEL